MDLEEFINGLPMKQAPTQHKTAEDLSALPVEILADLAGVSLPAPTQKVAAFQAKVSRHMGKCCDPEFLEQFEGTPLYAQAVALAEQELEMEKRHLQARMSRRMRDDNWEQECNERDMLDIQKSQLMLELHKQRAQQAQAAEMAAMAPPPMPGMEEGAMPPEAPPEMAAEKLAAPTQAELQKQYQDLKATRTNDTLMGAAHALDYGRLGAAGGGLLGTVVGRGNPVATGVGTAVGGVGGAVHGWKKGKGQAGAYEELHRAYESGDTSGLSSAAQKLKSEDDLAQDDVYAARQGGRALGTAGAMAGGALGALAGSGGGGRAALAGGLGGAALGGIGGYLGGRALGKANAARARAVLGQARQAGGAQEEQQKAAALSDEKQEKGLGKAVSGLASSKSLSPGQKAGLAKGLTKAIKKEQKEDDPVKLSSLRGVLGI